MVLSVCWRTGTQCCSRARLLCSRKAMTLSLIHIYSMLTAMMAVDDIIAGSADKSRLWEVNTEMEYHEEEELSLIHI